MVRARLVAAALFAAGCRVGKLDLAAGLKLDDGACAVAPGNLTVASPSDVVAAATDGTRIFTIDGPTGDLRSQSVGGGTAVVLAKGGHADSTR